MKKVLVIGINGQVGKEVMRLFSTFSNGITAIGYGKDELDITTDDVSNKIVEHEPDIVVNCSAYNIVVSAEEDNTLANKINGDGVTNLAKVCSKFGCELIHISTDYVFDGLKGTPYTETDKVNPLNEYGKSKLMGEEGIRIHCDEHYIIRTSWVYSQYERNFVNTMLNKMLKGEDVKVVDDQIGCPTSATSVARLISLICRGDDMCVFKYGTYNFTGDTQMSWYEFAKTIRDMATYFVDLDCKVIPIKTADLDTTVKRPYYSGLNNEKVFDIIKHHYSSDNSFSYNLYKVLTARFGVTKRNAETALLARLDTPLVINILYSKIDNLEKRLEKRD
jgi:dTDP-4-dehydrorhamnose reductase